MEKEQAIRGLKIGMIEGTVANSEYNPMCLWVLYDYL